MVVAQLAEQSFLTPEIRSSNPNLDMSNYLLMCQLYYTEKVENKEKEDGIGPVLSSMAFFFFYTLGILQRNFC